MSENARVEALEQSVRRLSAALQWMVDNDDTNEGDVPMADHGGRTWDDMNSYWIQGKQEAVAALEEASALEISPEESLIPSP